MGSKRIDTILAVIDSVLNDESARPVDAMTVNATGPDDLVPDEIRSSWEQSIAAGLRADRVTPPQHADVGIRSDLLRAAGPVVDRLAADLSTTEISAVLTDAAGRVVARRTPTDRHAGELDALFLAPGFVWRVETVGTSALGLALEGRAPALVDGEEHFMQALKRWTTASAPVNDPRTGQIVGAVSLICPARSASSLLLQVARNAAREVEQRLLDGSSARERLLDEHFLRARRRARAPLVVIGHGTMVMNAAASRMVTRSDQPMLWGLAETAIAAGARATDAFMSSRGSSLVASVEPVHDGDELAGAVLYLSFALDALTGPGETSVRRASAPRPIFGWRSLTDNERHLAALVADGLSNKEVGARLFLSHHTVDSHLRHIFRKLDINSRIELTRLVACHAAEEDRPAA